MQDETYTDELGVAYSIDRKTLIDANHSTFDAREYHIPEGTIRIEANAFYGCESLEKIYIPDSVTYEDGSLCESCRNLKFAKLSPNIKHPQIAMFYGCVSLEEVILPEGIMSIGENMFSGCKSLKKIHLPSSIRYFSNETFCDSGIEEIMLPDALESIGDDAFVGCRSLKRLTIPRNVKEIGGWLVQGHAGFEGIECLSPHFRVESDCLISNDDNALIACWTKEQALHVPESVRIIRSICNDQIERVVIASPIDKIGRDAFCANPHLKEIIYKAEVKEAEESYGCDHIIGSPTRNRDR